MAERYRGYTIERNPKPVPFLTCRDCPGESCARCGGKGAYHGFDWDYTHDDYDGPGDPRFGSTYSPGACREAIDELEGEADPPTKVCERCNGNGYPTIAGVARPDADCGACGGSGSVPIEPCGDCGHEDGDGHTGCPAWESDDAGGLR